MAETVKVGDRVRIVALAFKDREGRVEAVADEGIYLLLDGMIHTTMFLDSEYKRIEKTKEVI